MQIILSLATASVSVLVLSLRLSSNQTGRLVGVSSSLIELAISGVLLARRSTQVPHHLPVGHLVSTHNLCGTDGVGRYLKIKIVSKRW